MSVMKDAAREKAGEGDRQRERGGATTKLFVLHFFFESTSTSASASLFLIYALSPTVTLAFFSRVCCFQPRLPRILSCETSRVFCFASSTCHFSTRTGRGEVSTAPVELRPAERVVAERAIEGRMKGDTLSIHKP